MGFLLGEHALGQLGATGKAVGEIQRFGNHDARIAVGPIGRRGALKGDAEAEFQSGKIVDGGALVIGIADGQNLARKDAGLCHRAGVGAAAFGFENGEDDGVAFNENFFRGISVQELFHGFVEIQAEMRSRAQARERAGPGSFLWSRGRRP